MSGLLSISSTDTMFKPISQSLGLQTSRSQPTSRPHSSPRFSRCSSQAEQSTTPPLGSPPSWHSSGPHSPFLHFRNNTLLQLSSSNPSFHPLWNLYRMCNTQQHNVHSLTAIAYDAPGRGAPPLLRHHRSGCCERFSPPYSSTKGYFQDVTRRCGWPCLDF